MATRFIGFGVGNVAAQILDDDDRLDFEDEATQLVLQLGQGRIRQTP